MPQANRLTSKPHDFKGLADWIEVFRAGTHVDSAGKKHSFTASDLDQMASNHCLGAAPAVLGHPKHNDPAYAWVSSYKREGDALFAKFTDINPAFEQGVASGAYRNRSLSLVRDPSHGLRVRHVGWLGAVPPAIDGLKPVEFGAAADGAEVIEFANLEGAVNPLVWLADNVGRLFRGFREYLIEKDGIDAADRVVPGYQVDQIASYTDQARAAMLAADPDDDAAASGAGSSYSASATTTTTTTTTNEGGDMALTDADLQRARDEATAAANAATEARLRAEFAAKEAELLKLTGERQAERIAAQIADLKSKGLVTPAEEAGLASFMASLEAAPTEFSFSAPDNTTVKKSPAVWFAEFLAARKPLVKLGRTDAGEALTTDAEQSDDPTLISQRAMAFMAEQATKGITVELPDAIAKFAKK